MAILVRTSDVIRVLEQLLSVRARPPSFCWKAGWSSSGAWSNTIITASRAATTGAVNLRTVLSCLGGLRWPGTTSLRLRCGPGGFRWGNEYCSREHAARCAMGENRPPPRLQRLLGNPLPSALWVHPDDWLHQTHCLLELVPQRQNTLCVVSQIGWEAIRPHSHEQRQQRQRFCALWIAALHPYLGFAVVPWIITSTKT
jgi:hypothetical protein